MLLPAPTWVHSLLVCRTVHINCCSSLNKNIETNSHISLSETLFRLLSSQTTLAQLPGLCHGAVYVGGLSVRLQRPEVHLRGEVRHRGHPKAAESQNQNDSSPHFAGPSAVKDAVKVDTGDNDKFAVKDADRFAVKDADKFAVKDTVKFAIVSSVFVRLRTILVSSIYPSVVVGESGQSAVIEHFERLPKRPRSPSVVQWSHLRHLISPYLHSNFVSAILKRF